MTIPREDAFGIRQTINTALPEDEAIWHFRAGWNVAALNCQRDIHAPILDAYGEMLQQENDILRGVNQRIDARFREEAGGERRAGIRLREAHSTELYNYYASPAARRYLCATALDVANEYLTARPDNFPLFATQGLQRFEMAFEQFYTAYEAYQVASSEWDARYGARYGGSQPGWVAIYGTPAQQQAAGVAVTGLVPADPVVVPDQETGAAIPVIPVDDTQNRTPVVQPLPDETVVVPPAPAEDDEASE
ncbi:hypothetical protein D6201_06100 [Aurantiacibacter aquimixticola]|uniref:Uncharacterized protein n=2 Tax=Aurantiacibacter aquimixticola TaxID=1958945 RepID=A0A419RT68_9SPHN|nr:hypothetical protein D6201_06100 [Aurantiacibacter aquimixticola]